MFMLEGTLFLAAYAAFCAVFIALIGNSPEHMERK